MRIIVVLCILAVAEAVFYDPFEDGLRMSSAPATYDLRKSGRVFPNPNQRNCGSCYIHAVVTILEYWADAPISHQMVLDCTRGSAGGGCRGSGHPDKVLAWLHMRPVPIDNSIPFMEKDGVCAMPESDTTITVFDYDTIVGEDHLEEIIWTSGPVATSIFLSDELQLWKGDRIMEASDCGRRSKSTHTVAIVGYTPDAWIIKNSWGDNWADNGYALLRKGVRTCGLGTKSYFITNAGIQTTI